MKKIKYLSDEWIEKLNSVAQSHKGLSEATNDIELVIEYRVIGETIIAWQIKINKGDIDISFRGDSEPDVWFETNLSTAVSLFEGKINPLTAIIEGTMDIGGDPRKLLEKSIVFEQLDNLFETIRPATGINVP